MPVEIMTPGKNQKHYLADGWDVRTGIFFIVSQHAKTINCPEPARRPSPPRSGITGFAIRRKNVANWRVEEPSSLLAELKPTLLIFDTKEYWLNTVEEFR
jgi:hypothetical protein